MDRSFARYVGGVVLEVWRVQGATDFVAPADWTETTGQNVTAAVPVPDVVNNTAMRVVMQGIFQPDGRSIFTTMDTMLAARRTQTAALPDNNVGKRQALAAWTLWTAADFKRSAPLIAQFAMLCGLSSADVDAMFVKAGAPA